MSWYALRHSAARDVDSFRRFLDDAAERNTRKGPLGFFNSRHIRHTQARPEYRAHSFPLTRVIHKTQKYSLRLNRKRLGGKTDPHRDRQFRLLGRRRRRFQRQGWPVISVDTKKKELAGNFKNGGRAWRCGNRDVPDHDFPNPSGASKWNPIERRMFNPISANWAGEPLTSYEVMLKHIRTTRSSKGFRCRASLDTTFYPLKVKVSDDAKAAVRLSRHTILPDRNYTIRPRKRSGQVISQQLLTTEEITT